MTSTHLRGADRLKGAIVVTAAAYGSPDTLAAALPGERLITGPDALARARDAEIALILGKADEARAVLAAAPNLRWIHSYLTGVDGLLTPELERPGLVLTNNSGSGAPAIAEHALAMMMSAAKQLHVLRDAQARREWMRPPESRELQGAQVLVLGLGAIGSEVKRLAEGMGMRVTGIRRAAVDGASGPEALADLAAGADYLVVCAPLTAETRGLVSASVIARLPAHAWVVNVARSQLIDEAALFAACRDGRIGGAALDVWWEEPLPAASPWWSLPNVIVMPHRSQSGPSGRVRSLEILADNLARYRRREPLRNVVDTALGY
ncbi:MAG: D-2-hydroxyacid dehydrogenase [Chloroflexi bacterium]|nr:D-2-hydroxyacid dehydrogenase [Chloroflexota bacterium]